MLFGLNNAWATYQRMINKVFKKQLGKIMEGMLAKSMTFEQHILDLEEVLSMFGHHQMKFNNSKYIFTIKWEKFLGFLVSSKGIKPNLEKI